MGVSVFRKSCGNKKAWEKEKKGERRGRGGERGGRKREVFRDVSLRQIVVEERGWRRRP